MRVYAGLKVTLAEDELCKVESVRVVVVDLEGLVAVLNHSVNVGVGDDAAPPDQNQIHAKYRDHLLLHVSELVDEVIYKQTEEGSLLISDLPLNRTCHLHSAASKTYSKDVSSYLQKIISVISSSSSRVLVSCGS